VPIRRRASGGGTVFLAKGCLCYSLVLAYNRAPQLGEIRPSYGYILGRVRTAMGDAVPGLDIAGISDLTVAGRKVSGNSQQRKRRFLLHHGTLLYDFNPAVVGRYLRQPLRQPRYRQGRAHAAFLMNLPLTEEEIKRRLRAAWQADQETTTWPEQAVQELAQAKYNNPEWTRRR
jgi:lipoate-protein ligase A